MGQGGIDDAILGEEDWPAATREAWRSGPRTPTAVLVGLLLVVGGFWGGAILQKDEGELWRRRPLVAAVRVLPRARPSRTGSSLFGSGGATTGTVTDVIGKTLYVTSSSGSLVKVTLGPSATVTRNATSSARRPEDRRHGDRRGGQGEVRGGDGVVDLGDRRRGQFVVRLDRAGRRLGASSAVSGSRIVDPPVSVRNGQFVIGIATGRIRDARNTAAVDDALGVAGLVVLAVVGSVSFAGAVVVGVGPTAGVG